MTCKLLKDRELGQDGNNSGKSVSVKKLSTIVHSIWLFHSSFWYSVQTKGRLGRTRSGCPALLAIASECLSTQGSKFAV